MPVLADHNLVAGDGSERRSNGWVATTNEPWLIVTPMALLSARRWIRLRYATSWMDATVRPLIRFTTADGEVLIEPMNGAILGSAEWIGRVPESAVEVAICPARRPGRFNFRLESIDSLSTIHMLWRGLLRSRLWTYWTLRCLFWGAHREAWQAMKSATSGTPMKDYASWHARHYRPPDLTGFDAPTYDEATGPHFGILVATETGHGPQLQKTMASIAAQTYRRHSVEVRDATASESGTAAGKRPADWLVILREGEQLAAHALAIVADTIAGAPELDAIYTDEDCVTAEGIRHRPTLKPDWSPIFQAESHYVERACFVRTQAIPEHRRSTGSIAPSAVREALATFAPERIHHLRRILVCRETPASRDELPRVVTGATTQTADPAPSVSIVIPTKDRVELLRACLRHLEDRTDYPNVKIVIVDNGSTSPEAIALLKSLAAPKYDVVRDPGPFNFSRLCNAGAAASDADVLVFLNNDTEIRDDPGWLRALVRFAVMPKVGAVGAKLFFPSGRIQHAGVVLGMSGIAGHPRLHQVDTDTSDGRWARVPHEVSAVTGACLAVERCKFDTVGGFDEKLAVDLNDIDLCLRLSARGWINVWSPDARLIHRESSSRGIARDYFEAYKVEIACFQERWKDVIRDDPYFHPALSLYAYGIALA